MKRPFAAPAQVSFCAGFPPPAGVRKAPRHEIAGGSATGRAAGDYGVLRRERAAGVLAQREKVERLRGARRTSGYGSTVSQAARRRSRPDFLPEQPRCARRGVFSRVELWE